MKVKGEIHNPDVRYNFIEHTKTFSKRLDLNDLLKRAKEQREKDKKLNTFDEFLRKIKSL